jgi:hypothetical protein
MYLTKYNLWQIFVSYMFRNRGAILRSKEYKRRPRWND